jgi:hypothetical protein
VDVYIHSPIRLHGVVLFFSFYLLARLGGMRNAYRRLVRPRCSEDDIKMVLILLERILETGCESDDWDLIVQWRVLESKVRNFG